jgi:hypothetical protein
LLAANLAATVHTTGLNWESLGVIITAIVAAAGLLITVQERRTKAIRDEIKEAVDHLGQVLTERLETKGSVAVLSERVARLEGHEGVKGTG